jgi:hypothetical protein
MQLDSVMDLIAQRQNELERLLELYLMGTFDLDLLEDKKHSLEQGLHGLQSQKAELEVQLSDAVLSQEAIHSIVEFAQEIRRGLEAAERDFERQRRIVEMLNVRCEIETLDTETVKVHAHCILGDKVCVLPLRRGPEIRFW